MHKHRKYSVITVSQWHIIIKIISDICYAHCYINRFNSEASINQSSSVVQLDWGYSHFWDPDFQVRKNVFFLHAYALDTFQQCHTWHHINDDWFCFYFGLQIGITGLKFHSYVIPSILWSDHNHDLNKKSKKIHIFKNKINQFGLLLFMLLCSSVSQNHSQHTISEFLYSCKEFA